MRKIVGLRIGVFGNDEIRRLAVAPATEPGLLVRGRPKENGVVDPSFGSVSRYQACGTCLGVVCSGHTGVIELRTPLPHVGFLIALIQTLNSTCVVCAALLLGPEITEVYPIGVLSGTARTAAVYAVVKRIKARKRTLCLCPKCGASQPTIELKEPFFRAEWNANTIELHKAHLEAGETTVSVEEMTELMAAPYNNWTASYLLRAISEADQRRLGYDPECTTIEGMMLRVLLVPANLIRLPPPCDDGDGHGREQHQLSKRLSEVIKQQKVVQRAADAAGYDLGPDNNAEMPKTVVEAIRMLYWIIANYHIKDEAKVEGIKVSTFAESGHAKAQSIGMLFGGKCKRFRGNMMGKRVDHTARTVVTGGPDLDLDEIGVPAEICKRLTVPVPITRDTRDGIRRLIVQGKVKQLIDADSNTMIAVDPESTTLERRMTVVMINGWTAERYLDTGDIVLVNRQPTLHRPSMMGHRVRKVPGRTFQLPPSVVEPYNADFDGDEIVIHVPQLQGARAEAKHLMYCLRNLNHPRKSAPICGPIQDNLVGLHFLSRPGALFTRAQVCELLSVARYDPATPEEVSLADTPSGYSHACDVIAQPPAEPAGPRWSGRQIISALLPPCVTLRKGKVDVLNGVLLGDAPLTKSTAGSASGGLVHAAIIYGGGNTAGRMVSDLQRVSDKFMMGYGFNIGVRETLVDDDTEAAVNQVIQEVQQFIDKVREVGRTVPCSERVADAVEGKTCEVLRRVLTLVGNLLNNRLDPTSAMQVMTSIVKSKGSAFNQGQSVGTISQTFVVGGRPGVRTVRKGLRKRRRNLPNEPLEDNDTARFGSSDNLKVHGFVRNPFIRGITVGDLAMQAAAGREGLVDTSAKTPETGYIERQTVKCCENMVVAMDTSVQDARGEITQLRFGVNGVDPSRQFEVAVPLINQSNSEVKAAANGTEEVETVLLNARDNARNALATVYTSIESKMLLPFDATVLLRKVACGHTRQDVKVVLDKVVATCRALDAETDGHAIFDTAHLLWALLIEATPCVACAQSVCAVALSMHRAARMYPGEAVGVLASTSCGELGTQIVLNAFHFAGMLIARTQGVPRLKEVMAAAKNLSSVITTFELRDPSKAREIARMLPHRTLKSIAEDVEIVHEPDSSTTHIESDRTMVRHHRPFLVGVDPHVMRIVLDKGKASACGADAQVVADLVRNELNGNCTVVIASRPSDPQWVVRVYTRMLPREVDRVVVEDSTRRKKDVTTTESKPKRRRGGPPDVAYRPAQTTRVPVQGFVEGDAPMDVAAAEGALRRLRDKMMPSLTVSGVHGVEVVNVREEKTTQVDPVTGAVVMLPRTLVDVQGGTLGALLAALPDIIMKTVVSNDVMEVQRCLGVDCAAFVMFHELRAVLTSSGSRVAEALIKTLVDCVSYGGSIMPLNRHGANKIVARSMLAKASFEETQRWILDGAQSGSNDPLLGVSERAIVGLPILMGTRLVMLPPATAHNPFRTTENGGYDPNAESNNEDTVPCESYCEEVLHGHEAMFAACAIDKPPPSPELREFCAGPTEYEGGLEEMQAWRINFPEEEDTRSFIMHSPTHTNVFGTSLRSRCDTSMDMVGVPIECCVRAFRMHSPTLS